MSNSTQLVVIGAGPGGYPAAFLAADLGMHVTLIDTGEEPGGVCLYRGCIPSKALLHVAALIDEVGAGGGVGLHFGKPKIDLDALRDWKDKVVGKLTGGLGQVAKRARCSTCRAARASSTRTRSTSTTGDGERDVEFDYAHRRHGLGPATIPRLSIDSPRVMDSTGALELPDVPKSLLVVGGGYIGLELGTVYAALGSKVTVVEMTDGLLPGADRDLVERPREARSSAICETCCSNTKVTGSRSGGGCDRRHVRGRRPSRAKTFDACSSRSAAGRTRRSRTRQDEGRDGRARLHRGRRAAAHGRAGASSRSATWPASRCSRTRRRTRRAPPWRRSPASTSASSRRAIPAVVFTDPEIAWAGLTETQARRQARDVAVARVPVGRLRARDHARPHRRPDQAGARPRRERVLGVGIVGVGAGELIAEGVLAIEMGATADDLALTIHPHPTLSETSWRPPKCSTARRPTCTGREKRRNRFLDRAPGLDSRHATRHSARAPPRRQASAVCSRHR